MSARHGQPGPPWTGFCLPHQLHFHHSLTCILCFIVARTPDSFTHLCLCLCCSLLPRLPFLTFFVKTPLTHALRLCTDTISSRKHSLVAPGRCSICTQGLPLPSLYLLMLTQAVSLSPRLCVMWGHHLLTSALLSSVTGYSVLPSGGRRG